MIPRLRGRSRKLLVAAAGVATLNYANACAGVRTGNLVAPEPYLEPSEGQADAALLDSGNFVAPATVPTVTRRRVVSPDELPRPAVDAGLADTGTSAARPLPQVVTGNLIVPPPE
jgi:hypothetical protein